VAKSIVQGFDFAGFCGLMNALIGPEALSSIENFDPR
jgi:hypothetical protein